MGSPPQTYAVCVCKYLLREQQDSADSSKQYESHLKRMKNNRLYSWVYYHFQCRMSYFLTRLMSSMTAAACKEWSSVKTNKKKTKKNSFPFNLRLWKKVHYTLGSKKLPKPISVLVWIYNSMPRFRILLFSPFSSSRSSWRAPPPHFPAFLAWHTCGPETIHWPAYLHGRQVQGDCRG